MIYAFETLPTNFPVLERAALVLTGTRQVDSVAERVTSAAIRRAETMVGGDTGSLMRVRDMGLPAGRGPSGAKP